MCVVIAASRVTDPVLPCMVSRNFGVVSTRLFESKNPRTIRRLSGPTNSQSGVMCSYPLRVSNKPAVIELQAYMPSRKLKTKLVPSWAKLLSGHDHTHTPFEPSWALCSHDADIILNARDKRHGYTGPRASFLVVGTPENSSASCQ